MIIKFTDPKKVFGEIRAVIKSVQTQECWPHYFPDGVSDDRIRAELNPLHDYTNSIFYVSEDKGKMTGFVAGHDFESLIDNEVPHLRESFPHIELPRAYYQRGIVVHGDSQKGITGPRLFRTLEGRAERMKYKHLVTRTSPLNKRGIDFFCRLGFTRLFQDDNPDAIYFIKDIGRIKIQR